MIESVSLLDNWEGEVRNLIRKFGLHFYLIIGCIFIIGFVWWIASQIRTH